MAWGGGGAAVAQWLRCCATNREVAGSIPDGEIKSFQERRSVRKTDNLTTILCRCHEIWEP